jgi:hypothetical protein
MELTGIFSVLLALSGFGVDANPRAPTADQVLEHAVPDADLVAYVDVSAIVPRNFKALTDLPRDPMIRQSPDMLRATQEIVKEAQAGRAMVQGLSGIDLVTDISSVTAYVRYDHGKSDFNGVVEVRGHFPPDLIAKIAKTSGAHVDTIDGRSAIALDRKTYLGMSQSGSILVGTPALVRPRLGNNWRAPARPHRSALARMATALDEKPFAMYAFQPSRGLIREVARRGHDNYGVDLLKDTQLAIFSLRADGVMWAGYMRSRRGAERLALASDGLVDLMRAAQIAPRGFVKIAVASLDSYRGKSKDLDVLIRHKNDLLKIVDQYTGDGKFRAQIDKDPRERSVVVHALAGHISEVLPIGFLVPMGVIGYLTEGRTSKSMAVPAGSAWPAKPARPGHYHPAHP